GRALDIRERRRNEDMPADRFLTPAGALRNPIATLEMLPHFGKVRQQIAQHVEILAALSWKEQSDFALRMQWLLEVIAPARVLDLPTTRIGQALGGAAEARLQIGNGFGHHRQAAAAGRKRRVETEREILQFDGRRALQERGQCLHALAQFGAIIATKDKDLALPAKHRRRRENLLAVSVESIRVRA